MTFLKTLSVVAFSALAACSGTSMTDTAMAATPLSTEIAFRDAIAGKTVSIDGNSFTINADNTISGPWNGDGITGTWYWEDAYWCRDIAIGGVDRGLDCQKWDLDGSTAIVSRDRGNGKAFVYTIS